MLPPTPLPNTPAFARPFFPDGSHLPDSPLVAPASAGTRCPRLALLTLSGLDHFAQDLLTGLAEAGRLDVRGFSIRGPTDLAAALAWTDRPDQDTLWFEFCWPPFPAMIDSTDFAGRRVAVRVHRIEAYGSDHVARAPWHKVHDMIVVGEDMARRVRAAAPAIDATTRVHVVHNGIDLGRFLPSDRMSPFRIGWCGWMTLHKNPTLALQILDRLRTEDPRYTLHLTTKGGDPVAVDSFNHLARRMRLRDAIHMDGEMSQADMPAWHAANGVLLSTSVYESFGYAIAEAAAVGCDLAILDNSAAVEFWPHATRFGRVEEAVWLIRNAGPHRWRTHVARFSLASQIDTLRALFAPSATTSLAYG